MPTKPTYGQNMNIISLYRPVARIVNAHETLDTLSKLSAITIDARNGVSNANSQISYREKLDELVKLLREEVFSDLLVYESALIDEFGYDYLLPQKLALRLEVISNDNQTTLAVIAKEFKVIQDKISSDLEDLSSFIGGLKKIGLTDLDLGDSEAVFTVYYPSETFSDALNLLSRRFSETHGALSKILSLSGEEDELSVLHISSGSTLVILGGTLGAAATFALVLERLSSAFEKYQRGKLAIAEQKKLRVETAEIQARLDEANAAAEAAHEEILLEEIHRLSIEIACNEQPNANVGISAGIKTIVDHMIKGIDYDVLADLPEDTDDEDEAVLEEKREKVLRINNRESRKNIKLVREIERKIVKRIEARQVQDE